MHTGSFPGLQWARHDVNHPLPSSAEVKEKSRAISLIPLCAFMAGYEVTFTFNFTFTFTFTFTKLAMVSETSLFLDLQQQIKNKKSEWQQNEARVYKIIEKRGVSN
jgi:hypothetical protein